MWSYWPSALGTLIVVFMLREVFRDLFHPSATGSLSDIVAKNVFNLFRHMPHLLGDAGPLSMVIVILIWTLGICLGFGLIFWALPPENFKIESGKPPAGFWAMLYFSLEVFTTLGLGDYTPIPIWLRLLATFEALAGFGILTASVSSIILLHGALARMRSLARRISLIARTEQEMHFTFSGDNAEQILADFSADIVRTRVDLIQFPVVYYFYSDQDHASLSRVLPHVLRLANTALVDTNNERTRNSAALLRLALQDLAETFRARFVHSPNEDCEAVFQAYAQHHTPAA
jgi:Ion channel